MITISLTQTVRRTVLLLLYRIIADLLLTPSSPEDIGAES